MSRSSNIVLRSGMVLLGTIIGAGVFGIPLMVQRVGLLPSTLLFWSIVAVVLATHLFFAEIVLHYRERQRLAGYVKKAIPGKWYLAGLVAYPFQLFGATFAYLVLGGEFLSMIAQALQLPSDILTWQLLYCLGGAITVFFGLKFVAKVEVFATWFLIASITLASFFALPQWQVGVMQRTEWGLMLAPFGIFLFALLGTTVIPEIVELAGYDRKSALRAVALGTIGSAILTYFFGISIALGLPADLVGSGAGALQLALPTWAALIIPITGFLAVGTSFITTAQALKTSLNIDFSIEKRVAWTLTFFVPFTLLFITQRNFLDIMGVMGVLFGGINGILVASVAITLLRKKTQVANQWRKVLGSGAYLLPLGVILFYLFGLFQKFVL